jgi:molecular chaperone DnaK (HSP70)
MSKISLKKENISIVANFLIYNPNSQKTILEILQTAEVTNKKTYIGIDFGTSTTVVSVFILAPGGKAVSKTLDICQPDRYGGVLTHHLVNTVLAWHNNQLLFGNDAFALRQNLSEGYNVFSSFKMRLGVDLGPIYPETALKRDHGLGIVVEDANDATREFFKCLIKAIKDTLKKEALPDDICFAISVPASFEANQRFDLVKNMRDAGLSVDGSCLIDEPNAAFLSYLRETSYSQDSNPIFQKMKLGPTNILVYDFGAGTCDVSILEVEVSQELLKSRNRAISKFTALGGDDIDRAIAKKVLVEQITSDKNDFVPSLRDLEERLIPRLQPVAEILKITAIKWLTQRRVKTLQEVKSLPDQTFSTGPLRDYSLREHKLSIIEPKMTLKQLCVVLEDFLGDYNSIITSAYNVYAPIDNAILKSGLESKSIDAVLFIGGSSENPLVRSAIMEKLPKSVAAIVPSDLRSHVSIGAAMHSLFYHYFGVDMIQPITSEPISIIIQGLREETIIPQSTAVPTAMPFQSKFLVRQDGQKIIELPICVSNKEKLLGVLKIEAPTKAGFCKNEEFLITAEINHEKLLLIEAKVGAQIQRSEFLNPLSNQELTELDKRLLLAKQLFNRALLKYGSRPPSKIVLEFANAAFDANAFELAADMYQAVERLAPDQDHATMICVSYSRACRKENSKKWAKIAYERNQTDLTAYNLSLDVDRKEEEFLLRQSIKFNNKFIFSLLNLGKLLYSENNYEGKIILKECLDILTIELYSNKISESNCRILIDVAQLLNDQLMEEKAKKILEEIILKNPKQEEKLYDDGNLVDKIKLPIALYNLTV